MIQSASQQRHRARLDRVQLPGFELKRRLGDGGMANTYLAVQAQPERVVALKLLNLGGRHSDVRGREKLLESFNAEGAIVASLCHRHIVELFGVGSAPGWLYQYMEYAGGGDLGSRIQTGISPVESLDVIIAMAQALDHAHTAGVLHRDVKPSNILFRRDGTALLADFGIAKQVRVARESTTVGMLFGSPLYMSPEQIESRELDGRTDLYSLGIVLFELLTGRPPYHHSSALAVMMMHTQEPVPVLPVPLVPLQPLVDGLLAKDRDHRFHCGQAAVDVAVALRDEMVATAVGGGRATGSGETKRAKHSKSEAARREALVGWHRRMLDRGRLRLPCAPANAASLAALAERLTASPTLGPTEHAEVLAALARDPMCAAQLLRTANGAYFGARGEVASLSDALGALGATGSMYVTGIVEDVCSALSRLDETGRQLVDRVNRRSHRVFEIGCLLGPPELDRDLLRLGSLLHAVGPFSLIQERSRLALVEVHEYLEPARSEPAGGSIVDEITVLILRQWQIPTRLVALVASSARWLPRPGRDVAGLLGAARYIAGYTNPDAAIAAGLLDGPRAERLGLDRVALERCFGVLAEG